MTRLERADFLNATHGITVGTQTLEPDGLGLVPLNSHVL